MRLWRNRRRGVWLTRREAWRALSIMERAGLFYHASQEEQSFIEQFRSRVERAR